MVCPGTEIHQKEMKKLASQQKEGLWEDRWTWRLLVRWTVRNRNSARRKRRRTHLMILNQVIWYGDVLISVWISILPSCEVSSDNIWTATGLILCYIHQEYALFLGPSTYWIGGWVVPRAGVEDMEKRKFLTLLGLNSDLSIVQPIASCYTDCNILVCVTNSEKFDILEMYFLSGT
jgi:hypothetical protein